MELKGVIHSLACLSNTKFPSKIPFSLPLNFYPHLGALYFPYLGHRGFPIRPPVVFFKKEFRLIYALPYIESTHILRRNKPPTQRSQRNSEKGPKSSQLLWIWHWSLDTWLVLQYTIHGVFMNVKIQKTKMCTCCLSSEIWVFISCVFSESSCSGAWKTNRIFMSVHKIFLCKEKAIESTQ